MWSCRVGGWWGSFETVVPRLNERQRRVVAGAMAEAFGRGGQAQVVEASSISSSAIAKAISEVRAVLCFNERACQFVCVRGWVAD